MNEDEQVHFHRPQQRPDLLGKEVAGTEGAGVTGEKLSPGASAASRSGIDADGSENVPDGRHRWRIESQPPQLPLDSSVAPAGLAGQFDDELSQFCFGPRSASRLGRRRVRLALGSHPTPKGAWCDDRDQVLDRRAERHPELQQLPLLLRRDPDRPRQSISEDPVLDFQVLQSLSQLPIGGGGDQHEQRMDQLRKHWKAARNRKRTEFLHPAREVQRTGNPSRIGPPVQLPHSPSMPSPAITRDTDFATFAGLSAGETGRMSQSRARRPLSPLH